MPKPVEKTASKTIWPVTIEVVALNLVFGLALAGLSLSVGTGYGEAEGERTLATLEIADNTLLFEERRKFSVLLAEQVPELAGLTSSQSIELDKAQLALLQPELLEEHRRLVEYQTATGHYTNTSMKVIAQRSGDWWSNLIFGRDEASTDSVVEEALDGRHGDGEDHAVSHAPQADTFMGTVFGKVAGITFGLLLLSATNTAVMAMVSVLFAMARDRELPKPLTKLNYSGVPWMGLIIAVVIPAGVIAATTDVTLLAKLYVLGVCGAITVTVLSCSFNKDLAIGKKSRRGMTALGLFLLAITLTIGITQPISTAFSGGLVAIVLLTRAGAAHKRARMPEPLKTPIEGWLEEVEAQYRDGINIDPDKPKLMLAARGRFQAEFAVDLARKRGATLFCIFVRRIRVLDMGPHAAPDVRLDKDAQEALGSIVMIAKANNVSVVPIYVSAADIAPEILDHTVTYGCGTLIMGQSRRSLFSRKIEGDVVQSVVASLPDEIELITRSADTPHASKALIVPTETDDAVDSAAFKNDEDPSP